MRRMRGSALTEFVLAFGLVVLFFSSALSLCRLCLARQRALGAARFGALALSSGMMSEEGVAAELNRVLSIRAAPDLAWTARAGPFTETAASRFYRLVSAEVSVRLARSGWTARERAVAQKEQPW